MKRIREHVKHGTSVLHLLSLIWNISILAPVSTFILEHIYTGTVYTFFQMKTKKLNNFYPYNLILQWLKPSSFIYFLHQQLCYIQSKPLKFSLEDWGLSIWPIQPAIGDIAVGGFGHVDAVPAHVRRRVGAHASTLLTTLLLQVEVVVALASSTTASLHSRAETCNAISLMFRPWYHRRTKSE